MYISTFSLTSSIYFCRANTIYEGYILTIDKDYKKIILEKQFLKKKQIL